MKEAKNIGVCGYEKEENNEVYDRNYNGLRCLCGLFTI